MSRDVSLNLCVCERKCCRIPGAVRYHQQQKSTPVTENHLFIFWLLTNIAALVLMVWEFEYFSTLVCEAGYSKIKFIKADFISMWSLLDLFCLCARQNKFNLRFRTQSSTYFIYYVVTTNNIINCCQQNKLKYCYIEPNIDFNVF